MSTNTLSYLTAAVDIVRQFLPPGTQKQVALCGAISSRPMSRSWMN
jgi:hypothetical protein